MPQDEEIIIDISPDGVVTVTTKGFRGKSCVDAAKLFEQAIGKVSDTKLTNEYHLKESHQVVIKQTKGN